MEIPHSTDPRAVATLLMDSLKAMSGSLLMPAFDSLLLAATIKDKRRLICNNDVAVCVLLLCDDVLLWMMN